jgi:crotonobetainyl-CoA:carnitine CoA-transferase CaiB-like acyl-CoA transferase
MTPVQPLQGLRVAEVDASLALAFCGKYLAGLGADVVVHRPALPAVDSAVRAYVDDGKRQATGLPAGWDGFDVALTTAPLPDPPAQLVNVVISDRGREGPRADWQGGDFLAQAESGLMALIGTPGSPPTALGGHQIEYSAGVAAFTGAMVALHARDRDGLGQVVETSLLEVAAYIEWKGRAYAQAGNHLVRGDRSGPVVIRCADGHFGLYYRASDWPAVRAVLDNPLLVEAFDEPAYRAAHLPELRLAVEQVSRTLTRDELFQRLRARGVPAGPVNTAHDLLTSEHYRSRGFLTQLESTDDSTVQPALPVTFNGARPGAHRRAPQEIS